MKINNDEKILCGQFESAQLLNIFYCVELVVGSNVNIAPGCILLWYYGFFTQVVLHIFYETTTRHSFKKYTDYREEFTSRHFVFTKI